MSAVPSRRGCWRARDSFVLAVLMWLPLGSAHGQLAIERPSSLLVFPRVVADALLETHIEIGNSSGSLVNARCFYLGSANAESVRSVFDIAIPRSMSTHWVASIGRPVDLNDLPCSAENRACDGAGIDPGEVPALPDGFRGELLCVETDASGAAFAGNHLLGTATQVTRASGDVTRYAALGGGGFETGDGDSVLCLGDSGNPPCMFGAEYDSCPNVWILDLRPDNARLNVEAEVNTMVTIVPCDQNLAAGTTTPVSVRFTALTALGATLMKEMPIDGWTELDLSAIDLTASTLGDAAIELRISSSEHGIFVLGGEQRSAGAAEVAVQGAHVGIRSAGDVIVLPSPAEDSGVAYRHGVP